MPDANMDKAGLGEMTGATDNDVAAMLEGSTQGDAVNTTGLEEPTEHQDVEIKNTEEAPEEKSEKPGEPKKTDDETPQKTPTMEEFLEQEELEKTGGEMLPEPVRALMKDLKARENKLETALQNLHELEKRIEDRLKEATGNEETERVSENEDVDLDELSPFERRQHETLKNLQKQVADLMGQRAESAREVERAAMEKQYTDTIAETAKKYGIAYPEALEGYYARAPKGMSLEDVARYMKKHLPIFCTAPGAERETKAKPAPKIMSKGGDRSASVAGTKELSSLDSKEFKEQLKRTLEGNSRA